MHDEHAKLSWKSVKKLNKVSQNFVLVIIGDKSMFGAPINFSNELHTPVSVAFNIPSSVHSEMENTALIYSLTADPTERGRNWGIGQ